LGLSLGLGSIQILDRAHLGWAGKIENLASAMIFSLPMFMNFKKD